MRVEGKLPIKAAELLGRARSSEGSSLRLENEVGQWDDLRDLVSTVKSYCLHVKVCLEIMSESERECVRERVCVCV